MSFEQQVMSRRSFIYTSGPQWVVILSEGEFLFSLANMATSGSQLNQIMALFSSSQDLSILELSLHARKLFWTGCNFSCLKNVFFSVNNLDCKLNGGKVLLLRFSYDTCIEQLVTCFIETYTMPRWWCHRRKHPGSTHVCFLERLPIWCEFPSNNR